MTVPSTKRWNLIDQAAQVAVESLEITPEDVGGAARGYQVSKRRLRGGLSEGVDEVRVENGRLAFSVLPTRGMGLWKAWLGEATFGWQSPQRGPVHPQYVPLSEPSGLGWLDGFDELLVRCGLVSNGAPEHDENGQLLYPLHGKIANLPAYECAVIVDGETGTISVTGSVEESRFHFQKLRMNSTISTTVDSSRVTVRDEIVNLSASPAEVQMLYHTNFGLPLLDAGSQFVAPVKTVVPRNDHAASGIANWNDYGAEQAGFEEQVYFLELFADDKGQTRTLLKNAHGTRGAAIGFNKLQLPCYTVWKNTTAAQDGYVTGLEPGTNFPNPRTFEGEQGRVARLDPGGKIVFEVTLDFFDDADAIESAEKAIQDLQKESPKVYDSPQDGWCAP